MRRTTRARRTQVARVQGTSRPETSEQVLVAQELELRGLATEPLVPAGRTASSAVLRGVDEQGHDLVVRVLRLPPGRRGRELRQRAQVLRELETAGVVAVRAVLDLAGEYLAVVMDLVEGVDLGVLLAARGSLTRGEAAVLLRDLATGLAGLHAAGVVHGDLSPANVMVTTAGHGVLVDLVGTGTETGTPPWAAPEQERGGAATPASDVYSLAAVLRSCAHGALALEGRLHAVTSDALDADPARRPSAAELASRAEELGRPRPLELPQAALLEATALRGQLAVPTRKAPVRRRGGAPRRARSPGRRADHTHRAHRAVRAARAPRGRPRARRGDRSRPRAWWVQAAWVVVGVSAPVILATCLALCLGPGQQDAVVAPTASSQVRQLEGLRTPEELRRAVVELVARRDRALERADAQALASTTVPGSPAAQADAELLAALTDRGARAQGLMTTVAGVHQVEPPGAAAVRWPGAVAVRLTRTQQAYTLVEPEGVRRVPLQPAQEVVLVLVPDPWRVAEVAQVPLGSGRTRTG
ncbi:MAG: protein kinase [Actinomyces urogenitalis]|uniref:serine/threonine-protein kinase n=1 Tax=Actinomyces urogenitalis TaxID=103621 RepID=UPI0009E236FC|nr:protein kinase [Actinomyces urogenitalis]MBS6071410.1 protein kinase [Actinomyces urogenitalis]